MKKYFLSPILLLMFFSVNVDAQEKSENTEEAFAKTIMEAVLYNELDLLKEHLPTVDLARKIVGERAKEMTDEQISQGMLIPLQKRFQGNVDNIQAEIKAEKIDLKEVKFKTYTIEKMEGGEFVPSAMSIQFTYKDTEESIPVSILKIDDKWYLFEILISTNIFKE